MEIVLVVGKAPIAGFAKTRLAKDLGVANADSIYRAMLQDFFTRYGQEEKRPLYLYITPWTAESRGYFEELLKAAKIHHAKLRPQPETGNLFHRIVHVVKELRKEINAPFYCHLTGTDIPHFPFKSMPCAGEKDVVTVGPDVDGGFYYLSCWDQYMDALSDSNLQEGKSSVLDALNASLKQRQAKIQHLDELRDIDDTNDLKHFCLQYGDEYHTKQVAMTLLR